MGDFSGIGRTIAFLVFILASISLLAQSPFAPVGADWKLRGWVDKPDYNDHTCTSTGCTGNFKQLIVEDTIVITDKPCSVIRLYRGPTKHTMTATSDFVFVYEEAGQVFFYADSQFHLMLDFNLNVGDTLHFKAPGDYFKYAVSDYYHHFSYPTVISGTVIVEAITEVEISGELHKKMTYEQICCGDGKLSEVILHESIEGIGNTSGFFGETSIIIADGCHGGFLCYQDSTTQYYHYGDCDCIFPDETTAVTNLEKAHIALFPNPAHNDLHIETPLKFDYIEIYSLQGRILSRREFQNANDVSALADGIYFIRLSNAGRHYTARFVKSR